jgi:hypothetical protein
VAFALVLWFGAFAGFYVFYEVSHEVWWNLRFILPGTPALILAALIAVDAFARQQSPPAAGRARAIAVAGLSLSAVGLGWFWTNKFHLLLTRKFEQAYAGAAEAARRQFPADAVVVCGQHSGALYYYTNFPVLRYEVVDAKQFAEYRTQAEKTGRPFGAVLYNLEEHEALQRKCPGNWTRQATLGNVSLWRLDGPPAASVHP